MTKGIQVGLIGCGTIAPAYLRAAATFPAFEIAACADINPGAAASTAKDFNIETLAPDALLARDDIEAILNLTVPAAHAEVNRAALLAGKHVYCEKPFALDFPDGVEVLSLAESSGLRVGCAPDTFLGGGHQTVRGIIDAGAIGKPLSATACMMIRGHESWHPNPDFYYRPGGGPLFDMGPYYLTALVHALGPIARVTAMTGRGLDERTITSKPRAGDKIAVDVDTHAVGIIEFVSGAIATVIMSFDVWRHSQPRIEFHGVEGSLSAPDPNRFGGAVRVSEHGREWAEVPLTHGYTDNMRSIGLADMCMALRTGRPHRCSGALALHVLEAMEAFGRSSREGVHVALTTRPERPAPLPANLEHGALDA